MVRSGPNPTPLTTLAAARLLCRDGSIEPMTKLAACPGVTADRAKLTVYPDLFHDGWDQAYSGSLGDDIYTWMLGFSKP